jgi:hypothetical protein
MFSTFETMFSMSKTVLSTLLPFLIQYSTSASHPISTMRRPPPVRAPPPAPSS